MSTIGPTGLATPEHRYSTPDRGVDPVDPSVANAGPSVERCDLDSFALASVDRRRWVAATPPVRRPISERIVVVAPHPDDETLGAGGFIADACAAGCAVQIVVMSDGCASHVGVANLAAKRQDEARHAALRLGVQLPVAFWGFPDGALDHHVRELTSRLQIVLAGARIVLGPVPDDGHADHDSTSAAIRGALRELDPSDRPESWMYAVWAWQRSGPPEVHTGTPHHWRVTPEGRRRRRHALEAYRTQTTDLAGRTIVPSAMLDSVNTNNETFWC